MNTAEREAQARRRAAILSLLFFAAGQTMRVQRLQRELESAHGLMASVDRIRADVLWLKDVEMVSAIDDTATLTERGRDVVLGSAQMPGA